MAAKDVRRRERRCIEARRQNRWSKAGYGVAHIILAATSCSSRNDGTRPRATELTSYRELATAHIASGPPARFRLSRRQNFVRSGYGGGELICLA